MGLNDPELLRSRPDAPLALPDRDDLLRLERKQERRLKEGLYFLKVVTTYVLVLLFPLFPEDCCRDCCCCEEDDFEVVDEVDDEDDGAFLPKENVVSKSIETPRSKSSDGSGNLGTASRLLSRDSQYSRFLAMFSMHLRVKSV